MMIAVRKVVSVLGIAAIIATLYACHFSRKPELAREVVNPFQHGIYSTGIIESHQENGSNINIYPEVAARVMKVLVRDGENVQAGAPLLALDDTVQREQVAKDQAQIEYEQANLRNVQQQYDKLSHAQRLLKASVSRNDVDNAFNAVKIAEQSVQVAKAAYASDRALLEKYTVVAPVAGRVMRVVPAVGDYVSPDGAYNTYAQTYTPAILMETDSEYLQVRCFLDEILIPNLPEVANIKATLFVRGRKTSGIPLEYVNLQPFTVPNTQLSDERAERVDVRVLPIIFKFKKPENLRIYPGQLVDIQLKG